MRRLHRRLQLIAPNRATPARPHQQRLSLRNHLRVPQRHILLCKRNILAALIPARRPPRLRMQHQRQQPQSLRLSGQQFGDQLRQEQRLAGQIAPLQVRPGSVAPPLRKCGVDRFEHRLQTAGEFLALRNAQRDPRLPNLAFCTDQALSHGRWRG